MAEDKREAFLEQVLPELECKGRTGFISRSTVIRKCTETESSWCLGGATGSFVSILGIMLREEKQKETEKIDTEL